MSAASDKIAFAVPVAPQPQPRPRFFVKYKGTKHRVGVYTPGDVKSYKNYLALVARTEALRCGIEEPAAGPVGITIVFGLGSRPSVSRPDLDNLAKAVIDALTGVIIQDDPQIVEAHLYKTGGAERVEVAVEFLSEGGEIDE